MWLANKKKGASSGGKSEIVPKVVCDDVLLPALASENILFPPIWSLEKSRKCWSQGD